MIWLRLWKPPQVMPLRVSDLYLSRGQTVYERNSPLEHLIMESLSRALARAKSIGRRHRFTLFIGNLAVFLWFLPDFIGFYRNW